MTLSLTERESQRLGAALAAANASGMTLAQMQTRAFAQIVRAQARH